MLKGEINHNDRGSNKNFLNCSNNEMENKLKCKQKPENSKCIVY